MKSKIKISKILFLSFILSFFGFSFIANAETNVYYVRVGASGNGTDWANAYGSLPDTLVRGATYYVADGTYSGYTFDDIESGITQITIKKAIASEHGTNTGWSNSYGDGQAIFGDLNFGRDYYLIDGSTRNESNWLDSASYGFQVRKIYIQNDNIPPGGDDITIKYSEIGGAYNTNYTTGLDTAVYLGGFASIIRNITISQSYLHNFIVGVQVNLAEGLVIERSAFAHGWGKEAIRGQNWAKNAVIKHNKFWNACQKDPNDSTSGCTAEIGVWGGYESGFDNWEIYGNVFYNTIGIHHSDAAIFVGGNNSNWVGPGTNNTKIYNNTIYNIQGQSQIAANGSNNQVYNNLFYASANSGAYGSSSANNVVAVSNPFVNITSTDFHLAAATANGTSLMSPYNTDMDGKTRGADGVWDIGAYEYLSGSSTPIVGDINLDHIVNSIDYSILNSDWFTSNSRSDLNHDGLVNAIDYSLLNANWFKTW